jgi:hypothetical protein
LPNNSAANRDIGGGKLHFKLSAIFIAFHFVAEHGLPYSAKNDI